MNEWMNKRKSANASTFMEKVGNVRYRMDHRRNVCVCMSVCAFDRRKFHVRKWFPPNFEHRFISHAVSWMLCMCVSAWMYTVHCVSCCSCYLAAIVSISVQYTYIRVFDFERQSEYKRRAHARIIYICVYQRIKRERHKFSISFTLENPLLSVI